MFRPLWAIFERNTTSIIFLKCHQYHNGSVVFLLSRHVVRTTLILIIDYKNVLRNISVAIAGIFEKCGHLTQQDAPTKIKFKSVSSFKSFSTLSNADPNTCLLNYNHDSINKYDALCKMYPCIFSVSESGIPDLEQLIQMTFTLHLRQLPAFYVRKIIK
jgi:hypothetical protein